jgi:hypothetical protein
MSNTNADRSAGGADFNLSKHRWNDEVVRLIRASNRTQRRMAEWSPELRRHRSPI